jgi:exocyst complex component 3
LDKFLIAYIETFKGKNVKFIMPQAADKLREDLTLSIDFFSKSKSAKRIKSSFDCIDKLVALLEANPRLVYIDFFSIYKVFPDIPIDFIDKILSKRSDIDKSQLKEIIEGIKEKLKEDADRGESKTDVQTIFSKINYKQ